MKTRIDEVLRETAADLAQRGFDDQFMSRAVMQMKALPVETEEDRPTRIVPPLSTAPRAFAPVHFG